jgi:hypothetical protein
MERFQKGIGMGQASGFTTTVAATERFINDPNGGLC